MAEQRTVAKSSRKRTHPMGLIATVGIVMATAFTGCGHKSVPVTHPSSTTSSTTIAPTTTKPVPVVLGRLTGAPLADPTVVDRPALVVKIDNADPEARPQLGINQADVVYEERVEGSTTRLAAVFQSQGSDPVGPVRSARTTDVAIVSMLHHPLYAWSGANAIFARIIRSSPIVDVGYDAATDAYFRRSVGGKQAPHNLYAWTSKLWAHARAGSEPPPALFTYRKPGGAIRPGETQAPKVTISFGVADGAPVVWQWDPATNRYLRWQAGSPHVDEHGKQVAAANVIVQFVNYRDTGVTDVAGNPVPEAVLVGSGECWVLTGGKVVRGTWSKPTVDSITTYSDSNANPIALDPGNTWVELPTPGGANLG